MRFAPLLATLCSLVAATPESSTLPRSFTLSYTFAEDTSSIKPLATVFYNPLTLESQLSSWTPPAEAQADLPAQKIVRLTLPNGSSSLTSLATLNSTAYLQTLVLYTSPTGDGSIYSASIETNPVHMPTKEELREERQKRRNTERKEKRKTKEAAKKGVTVEERKIVEVGHGPGVTVKIVPPNEGAVPKLNSKRPPVIVDGKEVMPEEVPEKTFLQKYWWVIALFGVLALSGGKE